MSKTTEYFDEIKRRKGLTSNYQLAKYIEVSEQDISKCYRDLKHADEYIGTRIALALGLEPIHVLAEIRSEAEKNDQKRKFWLNFLRHAAVVVGSVAVLGLGSASINEADASTANAGRINQTTNYALLRRLARWAARRFHARKPRALTASASNRLRAVFFRP